jgi:hypothetical protein
MPSTTLISSLTSKDWSEKTRRMSYSLTLIPNTLLHDTESKKLIPEFRVGAASTRKNSCPKAAAAAP